MQRKLCNHYRALLPVLFFQIFMFTLPAVFAQENITRIQNSAQPVYGEPAITLTKEWEVGGEDPGFIFNNLVSIDVDAEGRTYVLDILESDVKVFDSAGSFLFQFGQKGNGPGDFHIPKTLAVLPAHQEILITDQSAAKRFNFFDLNGNYLHSFRDTLFNKQNVSEKSNLAKLAAGSMIYLSSFMRQNTLLLLTSHIENLEFSVDELWLYDLLNKSKVRIFSVKQPNPILLNTSPMNEKMQVEPQFCANSEGSIYVLRDNYKYAIEVYDTTGKQNRTITREYTLPKKTSTEYKKDVQRSREETLQLQALGKDIQVTTLKEKPIIYNPHLLTRSLFTDNQNRLWVLTNEPYPPKPPEGIWASLFGGDTDQNDEPRSAFSFDLFSPEGEYLMKIPFDAIQPRCFTYKDGSLYFAALKEDGFPWLFRYAIVEKN